MVSAWYRKHFLISWSQIAEEHRPKDLCTGMFHAGSLLTQTDFVHVWGMEKWMGLYEKMVNEFVTWCLSILTKTLWYCTHE